MKNYRTNLMLNRMRLCNILIFMGWKLNKTDQQRLSGRDESANKTCLQVWYVCICKTLKLCSTKVNKRLRAYDYTFRQKHNEAKMPSIWCIITHEWHNKTEIWAVFCSSFTLINTHTQTRARMHAIIHWRILNLGID